MGGSVLGVLAGQDLPTDLLDAWAREASVLVAADGAGHPLLDLGLRPIIVGDLDSLDRTDPRLSGLTIHEDSDPYRTDCDKLLTWVSAQGHLALDLVGVEGDRLDHMLSTLMSVLQSPLRVRIRTRTADAWVIRPGERHSVRTSPGSMVSLLPLERSRGVFLSGVHWPLENVEMSARGLISISNRATADRVETTLEDGAALLWVERAFREDTV